MVNTFRAILCDRTVYDKKGKWKNPQEDKSENIFYFISRPLTLANDFNSYGKEQLKPTMEITVFGGKAFASRDIIELQDGQKLRIAGMTINYIENNILVRDMLKQRIESITLVLE